MKARQKNKQSKNLLNFAKVCERIANVVVEKVTVALDLQKEVDEYSRAIGDLLLTLCAKNPGQFIEHGTAQKFEISLIFQKICELQKENHARKEQVAQYSQENKEIPKFD